MLPSFRFPIRYKLVALSLIVALAPLTLATILAQRGVRDVEEEMAASAQTTQQARVTSAARLLDAELQSLLAEATAIAGLPELRTYLASAPDAAARDRVRATLTALARKDGAHEALSLVGRDGVQLVSSTAADEGTNISAQPSFQQALTGTANISDIALSPSTGRPVFFVSVPVSSGSGGAVGVLRLRLNPSVIFQRIVADAAGYGAGASTMLVDEHGVRLALSDPTQNQLAWDGGVLLTVMTEPSDDVRRRWAEEGRFGSANAMASVNPDAELWQAINAGGTSPTGLKRAGAQQHVASATLTVKPWRYVSITPDSSISAITDATLADLTRISVLTAAAAVLVALLFSLTMTRPLLRLARAVDEVSMGDTSVTMEARSNDEIGDLAAAFSRMVASLRFYARKSAGQQPGPDNPLNLFDHAA